MHSAHLFFFFSWANHQHAHRTAEMIGMAHGNIHDVRYNFSNIKSKMTKDLTLAATINFTASSSASNITIVVFRFPIKGAKPTLIIHKSQLLAYPCCKSHESESNQITTLIT